MSNTNSIGPNHLHEFLAQALETEKGGLAVYETAIRCAQNEDLAEEWDAYLDETDEHARVYVELLTALEMDTEQEFLAVVIARKQAEALVDLMEVALAGDDPDAAEIVAAECVVSAETKCNLNWELVGAVAKHTKGAAGKAMKAAFDQVHEQENEHLFHTKGWARELWIQRLGMPAVLPPPEEEKGVKTAIGAEKAKNAREDML